MVFGDYVWMVGWDQGVGDVGFGIVVQQVIWIVYVEGQVQYGGNWCQGDVVFVLGDVKVQCFMVFMFVFVDDVYIGNGGCI